MTKENRQKATFWIRLIGTEIRPRVVPVRAVATLLKAAQMIALGAETVSPANPTEIENRLSLISVKNGSALYGCFTEDHAKAFDRIRLARTIVKNPRWQPSTSSTARANTDRLFAEYLYSPLKDLSRVAHSTQTKIEFYNSLQQRPLFTCDSSTFRTYKNRIATTGPSTVYAKIERVGGINRKCMIRPFDQTKLVYCKIASDSTAKELGKRLYSDAILSGIVTKMNYSGEVRGMTIDRVQPFKRLTADELIGEMRAANGMAFDDIDMEEMERELYG